MDISFIFNRWIDLSRRAKRMTGLGSEQPQEPSEKTADSEEVGAKSGAQCAPNGPIDTELQRIVDAWTTLPKTVKAGIVAMVKELWGLDTAT